jgi:hypothetical protein
VKNVFIALTLIFFSTTPLKADLGEAWRLLRSSRGSTQHYPVIVRHLVDRGLYFSSIPYIKEYLTTTSGVESREIDDLIDRVVTKVGVRQFEVMPTRFLSRSRAPILQYILAKKLFREGKYDDALAALRGTIPNNHSAKPFALQLEASIYSITNKYEDAVRTFRECATLSRSQMSRSNDPTRQRQLSVNRDYCIVGVPRTQFAAAEYSRANLSYLDLDKSSYVWPEILFEEAWNSFYLRDYNRTLGKLVTYKAPVLDFIFNPEISVLEALSYMEMCLWDDTGKVVDGFYERYEKEYAELKRYFDSQGRNYRHFYLLAQQRLRGKVPGNELLNTLLYAIVRDPAYAELYDSFQKGRDELEIINSVNIPNFKRILNINVRESMLLQRDLIGAYVRSKLDLYLSQLGQTFIDMSYIKLEVLDRRKTSLYTPEIGMNRGRGDVQNLKRTDKQYFWTFNGEFWADELGDYVFSLKSECDR